MKFCPVVPEICCGQVHVPRKERRRKKKEERKKKKEGRRRRNGAKTISLKTLFVRLNYVLNTCVIVYPLQYPVSVIIISETMIIIQHQEVDSECL